MKRYTIILFVLSLMVSGRPVKGQSLITSGLRAGVALATLTGDDINNSQMLVAFNGGIFVDYKFSRAFSIHPEANLVFKGANHDVEINGFPFSKAIISYLQVPVLFKYSSPNLWDNGIRPSFFAGPALNVNITKDMEGKILDDVPGAFSVDQKVNSTAYDLVVGLEASINDLYFVDLRYDYGLSDIFESGDVKSRNITLSVGFIF